MSRIITANVFNVQRYCLQDGPGIRTTVFFKGCPLKCLWCHNPESQSALPQLMYYESKCTGCGDCLFVCPEGARTRDPERPQYVKVDPVKCALSGACIAVCPHEANEICGRTETTEKLFSRVLEDRIFYGGEGGMTLSGGEPAMQAEASLDLLSRAREAGIGSVIETSGYGEREFFLAARDLGATFYFDLKALDPRKHHTLCGVDNRKILDNLEALMQKGAHIVLRLPLIPGVNDSDGYLALLGKFLYEHRDGFDHAEIMKYHILGMGKALALARPYLAPEKNADADDVERWMRGLRASGYEKIVVS